MKHHTHVPSLGAPVRTFRSAIRSLAVKASALTGAVALLAMSSCADPHFFPNERPLFSDLDNISRSPGAQAALAQAKEDFALALHNQEPVHARYVETIPYTHSKVYAGNGYRLTVVHADMINYQKDGPEITLEPSITGGRPRTFDHIEITQI